MACDLCANVGGELLWQDARLRAVHVEESGYPGYCRVIWKQHVKEMSDLAQADRNHCMNMVFAVEAVLRELMVPDKVNIASLGNFTPHVHWHVIPRFSDDAHFPQSVWGERQRAGRGAAPQEMPARIARALAARLASAHST